jgi:DNA-binding transcriptional regulator GbsR (MarR family)
MAIKRVDKIDKLIFATLARANRPLSISQIADRTSLTWNTVNIHVTKMERWKTLVVKRSIRRSYVSISQTYLSKLRARRGYYD